MKPYYSEPGIGGTIWAWRAPWDGEVTVLRCDRCGTTFSGVLPLPRGFT